MLSIFQFPFPVVGEGLYFLLYLQNCVKLDVLSQKSAETKCLSESINKRKKTRKTEKWLKLQKGMTQDSKYR